MAEDWNNFPTSTLVHSKAIQLYDQERLAEAIAKFSPFVYPDGTLEFSFPNMAANTSFGYKWLHYSPKFPDWPLTHGCTIWHPAMGSPRMYVLVFRRDFIDRVPDHDFSIGGGRVIPGDPVSERLANYSMMVRFNRRPPMRALRELATRISVWLRSVEEQGLGGEGPMSLLRREIHVCGKRADIHFDARKSGLRTLNSLLLEGLNYAHEVALLRQVSLSIECEEERLIAQMLKNLPEVYKRMGKSWTEDDERKYLIECRGGHASERIVVPIPEGA